MGSHKSWAVSDMCSRAVNLAYLVKRGEPGLPLVLSARAWGFYDVLFQGCLYGAYLMAISRA